MDNQKQGSRIDISCFTADFWEDKVFVAGKCFPTGQFVVDLLNLDANTIGFTRLSVRNMRLILDQLSQGFIYPRDFHRAKDDFTDCLKLIQEISPLLLLDMDYERFRIERMMEESRLEKLQEYFLLKGKLSENNLLPGYDWYKPTEKEMNLLSDGEYMLNDLCRTLQFYIFLGSDIAKMITFARDFITKLPSVGKLNESNLITKLAELCEYGYSDMDIDEEKRKSVRSLRSGIEYVAIPHPTKKNRTITARRMIFNRFLDFLIADFYEGIHNGHYPRQCQICSKYFLRQDARNQLYCDGFDPSDNKKRSCRMIAADRTRRARNLAADHPIKRVCMRRLSTINTYKNNGKISEEFAEAAKRRAQNCRDRALDNDNYALGKYKSDMTSEAIYAYVKRKGIK